MSTKKMSKIRKNGKNGEKRGKRGEMGKNGGKRGKTGGNGKNGRKRGKNRKIKNKSNIVFVQLDVAEGTYRLPALGGERAVQVLALGVGVVGLPREEVGKAELVLVQRGVLQTLPPPSAADTG